MQQPVMRRRLQPANDEPPIISSRSRDPDHEQRWWHWQQRPASAGPIFKTSSNPPQGVLLLYSTNTSSRSSAADHKQPVTCHQSGAAGQGCAHRGLRSPAPPGGPGTGPDARACRAPSAGPSAEAARPGCCWRRSCGDYGGWEHAGLKPEQLYRCHTTLPSAEKSSYNNWKRPLLASPDTQHWAASCYSGKLDCRAAARQGCHSPAAPAPRWALRRRWNAEHAAARLPGCR